MDIDVKNYNAYDNLVFDKNNMQGRTKIIIGVSKDNFLARPFDYFQQYIGHINSIREKNNLEIEYLKKFKKGVNEILEKMRVDKSKINNISICNFAHEIVEFKKGFTVGKPIKYVNDNNETTDDMKYFLRYLKKINKKSKDIDKYENLYTYGIAHTFTSFNKSKEKIDTEFDSPFSYDILDSEKTCCVYSSEIGNPKLFSMVESYVSDLSNEYKTGYYLYTIYYSNKSMIIKKDSSGYSIYRGEKIEPCDDPITEYSLNQNRMGAFEPVLSSLKTLNMVRSNQLDDIEQFINAYMVFLNQDPKYIIDNIEKFRKNRIFALKTNNEKTPADVKILQTSLNHSDINQIFNDTKQDLFNQVGVPMATSNTGQGVSGEAQTYGGGWENAQAISNIETTFIMQYEREDLEKFIYISKAVVDSKVQNLYDVDIDIKYTINKSNNILTKMQSFKYWIDLGGTWERGLEITDLCDDSHMVAMECEENSKKIQMEQIDLEIKKEQKLSQLETQVDTQNDIIGSEN